MAGMDATTQFVNQQQQGMQQAQQMNSLQNQQQLQGAQMGQENNSTQQQIQTIEQQKQSENMKASAQRHQLVNETNNKCREMANETMNNRQKTGDKHMKSSLDTIKS